MAVEQMKKTGKFRLADMFHLKRRIKHSVWVRGAWEHQYTYTICPLLKFKKMVNVK